MTLFQSPRRRVLSLSSLVLLLLIGVTTRILVSPTKSTSSAHDLKALEVLKGEPMAMNRVLQEQDRVLGITKDRGDMLQRKLGNCEQYRLNSDCFKAHFLGQPISSQAVLMQLSLAAIAAAQDDFKKGYLSESMVKWRTLDALISLWEMVDIDKFVVMNMKPAEVSDTRKINYLKQMEWNQFQSQRQEAFRHLYSLMREVHTQLTGWQGNGSEQLEFQKAYYAYWDRYSGLLQRNQESRIGMY